ncbi:hypothetical protein SUGI_0677850 [Cryptomeria japonica]|nr:hypothetical protein SUGI_0677850 [Cryptomeria japonica]
MRLSYCSNALIRNCIQKFKSVPSYSTVLIGRAVDGAESYLNEDLFCDVNIGVDGVIEIGIQETHPKWSILHAIIVCLVVVVDSSTSVEDINQSVPRYSRFYGRALTVREGE